MSDTFTSGISVQAAGRVAQMRLIGPIYEGGPVSAAAIQRALDDLDPDALNELEVTMHGPGGSVHEGMFAYVALRDFPVAVRVKIPAIAASAYSFMAMAADPGMIEISDVARIMIHNPRIVVAGEEKDLRQLADLLAALKVDMITAYRRHVSLTPAQLSKALDETTWYSGAEAVKAGLASKVTKGLKRPSAALDLSKLRAELAPVEFPGEIAAFLTDLESPGPEQLTIAATTETPIRAGIDLAGTDKEWSLYVTDDAGSLDVKPEALRAWQADGLPVSELIETDGEDTTGPGIGVAAELKSYFEAHPLPLPAADALTTADFAAITAAMQELPLETDQCQSLRT